MKLKHISIWSDRVNSVGQVLFMLGLALCVAMVVIFATDRTSPFELVYYSAPAVRAGEMLKIDAVVKRDLERECEVTYNRSMVDRKGARFWESPPSRANSERIREIDVRTRNELHVEVQMPYWAPVGKVSYITSLDYECNPLHRIWPIQTIMKIETEVLPPEPTIEIQRTK